MKAEARNSLSAKNCTNQPTQWTGGQSGYQGRTVRKRQSVKQQNQLSQWTGGQSGGLERTVRGSSVNRWSTAKNNLLAAHAKIRRGQSATGGADSPPQKPEARHRRKTQGRTVRQVSPDSPPSVDRKQTGSESNFKLHPEFENRPNELQIDSNFRHRTRTPS